MHPSVFALLGLIAGSFLNVVILRYGERSLGGRSACPRCGKTLEWFELIPVLSWLVLLARCRHCGKRISVQYPLVELSTAALFFGIGAAPLGLVAQLVALPIISLLIAIFVYDLYHTIIPDPWVYLFALLAFASQFLVLPDSPDVLLILAGPLAAAPLFALWFVSRGRWMGFGDVKLALGMGWLLGALHGVVAVFFAFIIGAAVSVPLLLLSSVGFARFLHNITPTRTFSPARLGFTMGSEIPFGPFLIVSTCILWFMQIYGIPLPLILW